MFAKMRYLKAYEAKHLKAHEPARHLKAHEPAKHLKAADPSKTPAWAVVIAGTGVAVTLVGATTGQFQGTIKTNQGAVPGKSTSRSAVRQLLNATNSPKTAFAIAKPSMNYAVPQARNGRAMQQATPAKTSTSTYSASVSPTGLSPAHVPDERLGASGTQLLAAGGTAASSTAAATTAAAQAAALGPSGQAPATGALATTLRVPRTPGQPTTTMDQRSSMVAAALPSPDQATYSSDHPFGGNGQSRRHRAETGTSDRGSQHGGEYGRPCGSDHAPRARAG